MSINTIPKPREDLFFMEATGFSMYPFVKNGDRIIVKKVRAQDLIIGDIILYKDGLNNQPVCHRLVKKTGAKNGLRLFTRGDSGSYFSEPISESNLIGQVRGIIRNGKVVDLTTKRQIMVNWLIARFWVIYRIIYIHLQKIAIYIFGFLQRFFWYRKLFKIIFYNRIECRQAVTAEDNQRFVDFCRLGQSGDVYSQSESPSRTTDNSGYRFFALYKNRVVGIVTLEQRENGGAKEWWVSGLNVRIRFRGAGIGEKLTQKVIQFIKDRNASPLYLAVYATNVKAGNLYRNLGFKEVLSNQPKASPKEGPTGKVIMKLER